MNQSSATSPIGHHHSTVIPITNVNSPHSHRRLNTGSSLTHHTTPTFPNDHHGTSDALSGASSNSSMMNHGGSPTLHRHVINVNSSSLSTTPLGGHHHGSSSGSLTGHSSVNHHQVSSGISCESSSSNANTRTHSRLDHVHDHHHHHHLQTMHSLHSGYSDTRQRDRAPSSLDHHGHHHAHVTYSHGHPHGQNEIKNASVIAVDAIQVCENPYFYSM